MNPLPFSTETSNLKPCLNGGINMEPIKYTINLEGVVTRAEFHERICASLPCPHYYGKNLDAFYDLLTGHGEPWEITFSNTTALEQELPRYFGALKELCAEAQEEKGNLVIIFE
ncbi:MAG: hypothetical protein E7293_02560 [Lachnospiraceae bacterium]|nr:hypothetical protein [Lachnospiraceae bacterium]